MRRLSRTPYRTVLQNQKTSGWIETIGRLRWRLTPASLNKTPRTSLALASPTSSRPAFSRSKAVCARQLSERRRMRDSKEKLMDKRLGEDGCIGGYGRWETMNPELLGEILIRLPTDEVARSVAFVCLSWAEVVAGPYCWSVIDIEQWCRRCDRCDVINFVVRKLIRRARASVCRLAVFKLDDSAFSFVASCGKCLKVLITPMGEVSNEMVEKYAGAFTALTVLDISYCLKITPKGIETIGKQCPSLVHLKRNMPLPPFDQFLQACIATVDESEAMAVADTMPGLCHLQLAYGRFSDYGLDAIITKCRALVHLDIQGCWNVKMDDDVEEKCETIKFFRGPWVDDFYETDLFEESGDEHEYKSEDGSGSEADLFEEGRADPPEDSGDDEENAIDISSEDVIEILSVSSD